HPGEVEAGRARVYDARVPGELAARGPRPSGVRTESILALPITAIARWVSILAHPFVQISLLIGVVALRSGARGGAVTALVVLASLVVPNALFMVRQVRRGRWSNVDASRPAERPALFAVALGGLVVTAVWLLLTDPSSDLLPGLGV